MTTSCTAALELSAMLLDLGPGDTVIVPSFTFTTTALAYARQGARAGLLRHRAGRPSARPGAPRDAARRHVRAVVVVHYAGSRLRPRRHPRGAGRLARHRPDRGQRARPLRQLATTSRWAASAGFAALSFHETKNFVCGEGGALVLNDPADVDRARVLYDKGTNRRAFMLGQVDKYTWKDTGSSFGLSDVLAAYLLAQLEQREVDPGQATRASTSTTPTALAPYADELGFELMDMPRDATRRTTCSTCCCPTATAATTCSSAMREAGRRTRPSTTCRCTPPTPADGSRPAPTRLPGSTTSAAGCCACRSTTT